MKEKALEFVLVVLMWTIVIGTIFFILSIAL